MYLTIMLLIVVLEFAWSQYLAYRNRKRMTPDIPDQLKGIYNEEEYLRQQAYQKVNSRIGLYSALVSFVILVVVLLTGAFGWLDNWLRQYTDSEILLTLTFFGIIYVITTIISLPLDYYVTFVVEERFGFNKSTKKTFWFDHQKSVVLGIVFGGLILSLIAWFYSTLGEWAWVCAWGIITAFSLFMSLFYSNLIVPLFNKQTPLEEGELRNKIEAFGKDAGFAINNIYVMDASKRTSKANAYFTGFGTKKRIVLFDNLINNLSTDEIVAVLAHEIGHYKHKHTIMSMMISIVYSGILMFLLSLLLDNADIAQAFGSEHPSFHIGLLAFSLLFTPISVVLGILMNMYSRRNEYQADAYAAGFGLGDALMSGLKKLSVKSLSNLNPDSWNVFCYYSHPTLLQRIEALNKK